MDGFYIVLALHVFGVVGWIGGLSFVTMVVLPAIRNGQLGENRLQTFQAIGHRFVWQARSAMILFGRTGQNRCWNSLSA